MSKIFYGKTSKKRGDLFFVKEKDFQSPLLDYEGTKKGINELKRIQEELIESNFIPKDFTYHNVCFWWFFYTQLVEKSIEIINFIDNFTDMIEKTNPSLVKVTNDFKNFEIIKQICKNKKIPFRFSTLNYFKFKLKSKILRIIKKQRAKYMHKRKIKTRKKIYFRKNKSVPSLAGKDIFLSYTAYRRDIYEFEKGGIQRGEFLFQNIIKLLDIPNLIGLDHYSWINDPNEILEERVEDPFIPWLPLEILLENRSSKERNEFLEHYSTIIKSKNFQKFFEFKKILFWPQIGDVFERMKYSYNIPYWQEIIDSLPMLFKKQKPRTIFIPNEKSIYSQAIIAASKLANVKTIAVQHGVIYDYHIAYSLENIEEKIEKHGLLLPNYMLTFGKITKEILSKKGYPENKLKIFGNPNFLNLEKIEQSLKTKDLYKKYNIPQNQKIILFAPPGYRKSIYEDSKYSYDIQLWRKLLELFSKNKNYFVIMKPHPIIQYNTDLYQNILDKYDPTNFKIIQGNLFELIFISSLVISTFSTTLIDAMCFGRPTVQVVFDNVDFKMPFDNYQAVKVSSLENLDNQIEDILNDQKRREQLIKKGGKFVKDYYNLPSSNHSIILKELISEN